MILGVFWERCRYDWSEPETVTATVRDSNVFQPGLDLGASRHSAKGGGSAVEMTVMTRNFRNGLKGTIARSINHLAGRRLFGWYLRSTLAAIERTSAATRR